MANTAGSSTDESSARRTVQTDQGAVGRPNESRLVAAMNSVNGMPTTKPNTAAMNI